MNKKTHDIELRLLLEAIYLKYHYDFRDYSSASLKRRLALALERFDCETISQLQNRVLHNEETLPELLSYLTVQVSELFRDPPYFKALREEVIPHLRTYPSLKVWIPGCANGEEVYSMVILFREAGLEDRTIFYATDINAEALKRAEAGRYSLDRVGLFTENHRQSGGTTSLSDYYTAAYGAAIFDKSLKKRIVFSDHCLASDAVFAEVHLISCRNVLIYFRKELQDRAIGLFRNSLPRNGFLGLGAKESIRFSSHVGGFVDFNPTERIYRRRGDL
ncbi:CheR family methyltransferase [Allorhodopirellula solitaria]|uniref:Chemotaxis protein methyltransferase Cher2 n=1 Tax=Allorhodopirellula solitaria TaxID=2527987 RepID=A0A5C5XVD8_9BACT|nr:CheR family methyltransferase [Allorhodopirellula solitaria]TWT66479.1 Chemotaxis protein methyltransferase Cher2 [Allorhodopirellula solitaria]